MMVRWMCCVLVMELCYGVMYNAFDELHEPAVGADNALLLINLVILCRIITGLISKSALSRPPPINRPEYAST